MPLSNSLLNDFDSKVLRLPDNKRTEYSAQVDNLTQGLKSNLKDTADIKISKIKKAGSYAKHTMLRKTSVDSIDVDVVMFVKREDTDFPDLESLISIISDLLLEQYPTKPVKDFAIQQKATTVSFRGTGLNVDIVPVIEDPYRDEFGWQYDKKDGSFFETCPTGQVEFIQERVKLDKHFRKLIRLAKKWRNHIELKELKSYLIELIMAHILDKHGAIGTIEERFQKFLLFIVQSELKEVISFSHIVDKSQFSNDSVVILDPFCDKNNVANRITESERKNIINTVIKSWEKVHFASVEGDVSIWRDVFGRRFKEEYE